ncbi:hypothetical protein QEN19_002090 [Hanseniaspora menglaensis]
MTCNNENICILTSEASIDGCESSESNMTSMCANQTCELIYNTESDENGSNELIFTSATASSNRIIESFKIDESLNIETSFLEGKKSFKSPLVRKRNIQNRYIDTPVKTQRQSSQLLLDSLKSSESNALDFSLGIETNNVRTSSAVINDDSPFISSHLYKAKSSFHQIFETPEILERILFFTFTHEDPENLPPIYSQEYNTKNVIYANKLFYSIGIKYVQERLVFKNYRQLQKFNEFYKFKKQEHWLAPKTVIINFGSDGVFKQQSMETENSALPKQFDDLFINCNNITHLEVRSNRFIKSLPANFKSLNHLRVLKLPGLCNLSTASFENLISYANIGDIVEIDLRNCYSISELSLFKILAKTFNLKHLNLNRKVLFSASNSEKYFKDNFTLSDNILNAVQISKAPIETLAISGSKISDYGIWQMIALTPEVRLNLRRLSLNECFELKDGFFRLFDTGAVPNLQVLELKKFKNAIDLSKACKLLFEFRLNQELRYSKPLSIVLDGAIDKGVQQLQNNYNTNVGRVVLKELVSWVNFNDI